jgi:Ca-activated chloride channel homolog
MPGILLATSMSRPSVLVAIAPVRRDPDTKLVDAGDRYAKRHSTTLAPRLLEASAMRFRSGLTFLLLAACGASDSSPGGNVSFGGAQDIGEFRGIIERGEIPGPATLDANGFFNEHYNEPPEVSCGGALCLTPGLSLGRDFLTGAHQATLQVAVTTTIDPASVPRLPMNLVVVVDRSGSMSADGRLEKVKVGLHALIDNLDPEDRLALVSFDDVVALEAPFGTSRDELHTIVSRLQPRGGTNIYAGLETGMQLLEYVESEKQSRVIFLSDGLATSGNTSQQAIIEMATRHVTRGIGLTTIGVGNDFDVALMRGLAERGAGNFYYIEDAAAATEVFTEELDYFMMPLAMDVRIDAVAAPGWEFREVTGSRLWSASSQYGAMEIPAVFFASRISQSGELGRRGGGSMVFVNLAPLGRDPGRVADVTLSYRLPDSTERISHSVTLDYDRDPLAEREEPHLSYAQLAERYAMYNVFLGLRLATRYATSDYDCAAAALVATRASAVAWSERHPDPDLAADLVLIDRFLANLRAAGARPTELASCPGAEHPYGGDDYYPYGGGYMCQTGSASGGATVLAILGVGAVVRRRRRR